ncbi:MAG: sodium:calcium antiporter [Armatimonadota bacterium]
MQFADYSVWANLAVFALLAGVIWTAGVALQRSADAVSRRTGLARAFVGVLLLGAATSLPETASTISAARIGDPTLAVHALMGAVMTQMSLLVIADLVACRRGAITHLIPQFLLLFEGVGLVILLAVAIAGMSAGPIEVLPSVDLWTLLILAAYGFVVYSAYRMQAYPRWQPIGEPPELGEVCVDELSEVYEERRFRGWKLPAVLAVFSVAAVIIFGAGWTAARVAEALAVQTGLGASFIGVTLLAFATSTPELASVISASREGAYSLAFSNILGTNMYNVALLVAAELFYTRGLVFADVHPSAIFAAAIGALIVCVYLWGLLEHENRTLYRIGWDSAIVLLLYLGGYTVLYFLR